MEHHRIGLTLFLSAVLALLVPVSAAEDERPDPASMIRLLGDANPAPATIADAQWLVGNWQGRMYDMSVEHLILPAKLGQMPSFVRATGDGASEVAFYEISLFTELGDTIVNRVKHFTGELAGWEERDAFIERSLVELGDGTLYFDGFTLQRTDANNFTVYFLEQSGPNEGNILVIDFSRIPLPDGN